MKASDQEANRRDHLANERTFLAWIRTSIAVMAFGFLVEKFAIFLHHISIAVGAMDVGGQSSITKSPGPYSSYLGLGVIALGACMGVMAFVRYKRVERQIQRGTYEASIVLDLLLAAAIASVGVFLIILLSHT